MHLKVFQFASEKIWSSCWYVYRNACSRRLKAYFYALLRNKHWIFLISDALKEFILWCFLYVLLVLSNFAPYSFQFYFYKFVLFFCKIVLRHPPVSSILEFLSAVGVALSLSAFLWHQAGLMLHSKESILDINYTPTCFLAYIPYLNLLKFVYWKPSFLSMFFSHFLPSGCSLIFCHDLHSNYLLHSSLNQLFPIRLIHLLH